MSFHQTKLMLKNSRKKYEPKLKKLTLLLKKSNIVALFVVKTYFCLVTNNPLQRFSLKTNYNTMYQVLDRVAT